MVSGAAWFALLTGWLFSAVILLSPTLAHGADNAGLGPLSIRNQFQPNFIFLHYTPESPKVIAPGKSLFRYQVARTNTFINTQSPSRPSTWAGGLDITQTDVDAGVPLGKFDPDGYGMYVDVESERHLFRLNMGISESLEWGLELAFLSYSSGFMDNRIDVVERFTGGINEDRQYARNNEFHYYIVRNGKFLHNTSSAFRNIPQDPVFNLKWKWSEGGDFLPAISLKMSYKMSLDDTPTGDAAIINSGGSDYGFYLLVAKAVGNVVGHLQLGITMLDVAPNTYNSTLKHKMFGIEFRLNPENSLIFQSMTQTSIFIGQSVFANPKDFGLSKNTDISVWGYRYASDTNQFEVGFIEDYYQNRNELDISLYFELGWQW